MKKHFVLLLIIIGLSGICFGFIILERERSGPAALPVNSVIDETFPNQRTPLNADNIAAIGELVSLKSDGSGPVSALAFTPNAVEIFAVHGQTGLLQRWQINDGLLLSSFDVGPVGMAAVAFDASATKLAVGAGLTPLTNGKYYATNLEGVRLWDTYSGKQLHQLGISKKAADVALSSDGERLAVVAPGSLDRWDAVTGKVIMLSIEGDETHGVRGLKPIYEVAFDPLGEWILYVSEAGLIALEEWDPNGVKYYISVRDSQALPLAAVIDPSRYWAALVRGDMLEVWRLREYRLGPRLKVDLSETPLADLAFSQDGQLLAVGTANGWQIWDMSRKKLATEKIGKAVFAVTFSPDGQLFAWGDEDGMVHVWSVKEQ